MALLVFSDVVTITRRQRITSSSSRMAWTEKMTDVRPICSISTVKLNRSPMKAGLKKSVSTLL